MSPLAVTATSNAPWPGAGSREVVRGAVDAALGDDRGDQLGGRDVESRIPDRRVRWRGLAARHAPHLGRISLLDGDGGAALDGDVEGGPGRRHVERDAVMSREHRDAIRADLVCGV